MLRRALVVVLLALLALHLTLLVDTPGRLHRDAVQESATHASHALAVLAGPDDDGSDAPTSRRGGVGASPPLFATALQVSLWRLRTQALAAVTMSRAARKPMLSRPLDGWIDHIQESIEADELRRRAERARQRGTVGMDASLSFDAVTAAGSADQPSDQYPSQTLFSVHIFVDRNHTALQRLLAQLDAADSTGIRDNIELHLHMALDAPVKVVKAVHAALWRHGTKRIDVRMARDDLPSIVAARWPSGSPYALVLDETASVSPAALQYARWCVKVFLERPPFHLGSQLAGCNLVTQPHVAATLGYWPGSSDSRRNIAASRLVYSASVPASGVLARKAIWRDFSTEFADWKRLLDSAHETDPRSSVLARRVLLGEYVPFAASSGHAFEDVPAPTTQPLWMSFLASRLHHSRHFFVALNIPENRTFVLDTAAEAHDAPRELFGRQEVADLLVTLPATTEERGSIESKMPQLTKYGLVAPQYLTRAE